MKGDALHRAAVGVVVLEELVRARVPEFNGAVAAPGGDTGAIGVELHIIHLRKDVIILSLGLGRMGRKEEDC